MTDPTSSPPVAPSAAPAGEPAVAPAAGPAPGPATGTTRPGGRRPWLLGGVALAATVLGAGYAWQRLAPRPEAPGALDSLWSLGFDTPAGTTLALSAFKGKPLVINFWATWCPPCVEELPLLDNFYKQNAAKSWQVIGLAIDQPSAVRTFLLKNPISFPIGLAGLSGTDLGKSLGNPTGGLPFTVVLDARGAVAHRRIGKVSADDLRQWAALG